MERPSAFVIMSFAPEHQGIYDAVIKPTFEEQLGWQCWRADERPGAGNIVRQIVDGIAGATLVVADLTALRPNVLYELGVAHALGNNVLTLFRRGGDAMPFDLRSYRYIDYEDTAAGARKLQADLVAAVQTLAQWGVRPSNPVQDFLPVERRVGAPASPVPPPADPTQAEPLRELAYSRELAAVVRKRLHYVQLAQARKGTDPTLDLEAGDLTKNLDDLRGRIAALEAQAMR
jgi:hypothetical protein